MNNVFVYGSLKRAFHNHFILQNHGVDFLGVARTDQDCYNMRSFGGFPAVFRVTTEDAYFIFGELFVVDSDTLREIDELESNGQFYRRELVTFRIPGQPEPIEAWMYLLLEPERYTDDFVPSHEQVDVGVVLNEMGMIQSWEYLD